MRLYFSIGKNDYRIIREVFTGEINDVYVCRNDKEPTAAFKTVWIVKERRITKALMGSLGDSCEEFFMQDKNAGFVFPYFQERPLHKFYLGNIQNKPGTCHQIWLELVTKCMISGLPDAVMYLMLKQGQVHLSSDGKIWFGFLVDLSEYDESVCERDTVAACAKQILELICLERDMQKLSATARQAYMLLEKKLERDEYCEFMQLYRDMKLIGKMTESGDKRIVVRRKIEQFQSITVSQQDKIYRLLSCACIILVCMVVLLITGHLLFGEISFWKLFGGSLDRIGTESLLQ